MTDDPTPTEQEAVDAMNSVWGGSRIEQGTALAMLRAIPRPVLVNLAAEKTPDEPHIVKFDEDGWTLKHPLKCRLGDLFDCAHHAAAVERIAGPPKDGPGLYELRLDGGYTLHRLAPEDE